MKIKCLGGFREVGRNAVLIEGKENIVFDYGAKVETGETPVRINKPIDTLLLTHAHLDHTGSVPVLYQNQNPKIYSTISTFDQAHLLLKDSMKVAKLKGHESNYTKNDMEKMKKNENNVTYGQQFETRHALVDSMDAGHIPGSMIFVVDTQGKRIMYTGDFKLEPTRLLSGAKIKNVKDIDVLIMESTYSSRDHSPREQIEKELLETVKETIDNNGIAIIPSFAVGRAAEIIMILNSVKNRFPVYLDGMAKKATEIALNYPEFIRDPKALKNAYSSTVFLSTDAERKNALREPCAIVTTGGCIDGGPAVMYIKQLFSKPECSLIFTGFQIPRTAGRYLQDTGRFVSEEFDLKIKMNTKFLDFSAHAGRSDLIEFVKRISPQKVICIHGEYCERFATELRGRFGIEAIAPKNGESVEV